mmetsp:Transcript_31301/g.99775  ORF Transcript_31301/g.99775 Transcript_31301/m.99775 type:complete len:90 (-) Transcript_31301:323-592(-)
MVSRHGHEWHGEDVGWRQLFVIRHGYSCRMRCERLAAVPSALCAPEMAAHICQNRLNILRWVPYCSDFVTVDVPRTGAALFNRGLSYGY